MATLTETVLHISSPAFNHKGYIPMRYTCEGENINPALEITDIPDGTKTMVLLMDDPDAPGGTFDHWIVWNIPPQDFIKEDSVPGTVGKNGRGEYRYTGPCPPTGTHRYFFKVYALDTLLDVRSGAVKSVVERAMDGHVLGYGELIGLYRKTRK